MAAAKSELHLYAKTRFPALLGRATNCPHDGLAQTLSRVADLMLVRLSMSDTSCLPPHFTPPAFVVLVELVEHNKNEHDMTAREPANDQAEVYTDMYASTWIKETNISSSGRALL